MGISNNILNNFNKYISFSRHLITKRNLIIKFFGWFTRICFSYEFYVSTGIIYLLIGSLP